MLKKKHKLIHIPVLNDFIYSILYNATFQEKRGLKGRYLQAVLNERAAKHFAENSSREEKEFILTYFGYSFCYVIYKKSSSFDQVKEIIAQERPDMQRLKGMSAEGIYLHSDLEFQRYLGITAHALHHHNFQFNNEIVRAHYHIQKWSKIFNSPTDIAAREMDESIRQTAKFLLSAMIGIDNLPTLIGIGIKELTILLYFYQLKDQAIKRNKIDTYFVGYFTRNALNAALLVLIKGDYLSSVRRDEGKTRPWYYSITSIGIRTVNNYFQHVYNKNAI